MDIQQPTAPPPSSPQQQPQVFQPSGSFGRPATMEYTRPRPDEPSSPSFTPTPRPAQFEAPKQKKSKKGLVIALFVILFLGLAAGGGAYYYFTMYKKETVVPAQNTTPAPTETESSTVEATPEGVDKATEQIDKQMNSVDDTQDFTTNDVSDDGLGL